MLLVIPLSLLAALLFAVAAACQQRAARAAATAPADTDRRAAPDRPAAAGLAVWLPVLAVLHRLVRDRLWLTGWLTNLLGFFVQAAALHLGSIAVVQPLLVAQLLFALPLSVVSLAPTSTPWSRAQAARRRLLPRDWLGGAAVSAGLVVLLTVRGAAPQAHHPNRIHVLLATGAAAALVAALVVAGRAVHGQPQLRAALVAVAAGLCFCLTAVFITLTATDLLHRGVAATAVDWPGYALAASTLLGLLLEQDAFAAGSLPTAVAAMTITNPVASYFAGILAFHGQPPTSPGGLAGVTSAAVLVVVGVVLLAHSPTVHDELTPGPAPTADQGVGDPGAADPGARDPGARDPGAADSGARDPEAVPHPRRSRHRSVAADPEPSMDPSTG